VATILANTLGPAKPAEHAGGKPRFWRTLHLFSFWHLASLDAPTVAVVWGWALAWAAHVKLAVWPLALLGLVVWAIYVGDRLLDARAGMACHDLRERHHFHWRHRRILAPLAAIAGLAAVWIVRSRVPLTALPQDSAVAAATLAYFSGVHSRFKLPAPVARVLAVFGTRECLVGVLFAAGCTLPAWSMGTRMSPASLARLLAVPGAYFSALAWLNVRAITHWEAPARSGLWLGRIAWVVAAVGLLLAAWLLAAQPRAAGLVAAGAAGALLIGWLDWRHERFSLLTLRVAVDLVLLTPVILAVAAPLVR
jgi:hypothetical protein